MTVQRIVLPPLNCTRHPFDGYRPQIALLCIDSYRQCISIGPIYVSLLSAHLCTRCIGSHQRERFNALSLFQMQNKWNTNWTKAYRWNAQAYLCIKIVLKLKHNITALYCLLHMQEKKRERALYRVKALKFATALLDHRLDKTPTGTTAILVLL